MRIRMLSAAPLLLAAACATAPAERQEGTVAGPAISEATLRTATQILSSDAFEGRAPTTAGEEKTVRYLAEQFREAGLQPGNKGSWFQEVPLVETNATPTPLRITGGNGPLTFAYRTDMVANSYQVQPKISLDNSDIVFVGYGINAPERGWNDYEGLDVRGKTVVILVNDPDWQTQALEGPFNGRAMTYYGRWTYKYEEAARQGAAAALIVHETEPAAYGWNVVQSSWTGPQYNMDDPNNHMDQSKVIGWLTRDSAVKLFDNSGLDYAQLKEAAKRKGFRAVPLKSKASLSLTQAIKRQKSRNVIGILPGTTRPDEYDPNWDWSGAVRDLKIYYRIGRELAESEAWPNWREGDEFRAIRDRSRAGR